MPGLELPPNHLGRSPLTVKEISVNIHKYLGVWTTGRNRDFFFRHYVQTAQWPMQRLIINVLGAFHMGVKPLERKANHSSPSSIEVNT